MDKKQPRLSVVTVCLNSARTIERTVGSVIAQSYPDVEYIIVDGMSSDGTLEILSRYRKEIDVLVSERDDGVYDAMNKGIRLAQGEWIHLLNADDAYVDERVLARAVLQLRREFTNYFSMYRSVDGVVRDTYRFPFRRWKLSVSAKLPHPALLVHRDQYRRVGLYDTQFKIAADHDMIMRLLREYPPNFVDMPLVMMDQRGLSTRNLERTYRDFMQVSIKNGVPAPFARAVYWLKRWRWT